MLKINSCMQPLPNIKLHYPGGASLQIPPRQPVKPKALESSLESIIPFTLSPFPFPIGERGKGDIRVFPFNPYRGLKGKKGKRHKP